MKQQQVVAGLLDFPRQKLPESVWLYQDDEPLPRLQPALRSLILREARYRLSRFGAEPIGAMLYGGAATYQYHEGADIDVSVYIDWDTFQGDERILEEAFKEIEIPWEGFVVHLFVKPQNQPEQVEVADAVYDVWNDRWKMPPLVLPGRFDPEIFFQPLLEHADLEAQEIDLLMGKISREWAKLKKALQARKEGPRDPQVVDQRIELQKKILLDYITMLCERFVEVWQGRKKLHDSLRQKYINNLDVGKFERFQYPEVMWKYLDQAGYVEFLKVLAKALESGVVEKLLAAL
jgi:predicted nucleotidyltransferase